MPKRTIIPAMQKLSPAQVRLVEKLKAGAVLYCAHETASLRSRLIYWWELGDQECRIHSTTFWKLFKRGIIASSSHSYEYRYTGKDVFGEYGSN